MPKRFPPFLCLLLLCAERTNLLLPRYTELKLTLSISSGWWFFFFPLHFSAKEYVLLPAHSYILRLKIKPNEASKKLCDWLPLGAKEGEDREEERDLKNEQSKKQGKAVKSSLKNKPNTTTTVWAFPFLRQFLILWPFILLGSLEPAQRMDCKRHQLPCLPTTQKSQFSATGLINP